MVEESDMTISKACKALKIPRRNFYNWKNNPEKTTKEERLISTEIEEIAVEFPKYGYRRVTKEMKRRGFPINHKKVSNIMQEKGLQCRKGRKFRIFTTDSNHGFPIYPNLAKDLEVTDLNQLWVADLTYIHLPRGFIYLAAILDVFSRKCIGWALSERIDTELALGALRMALKDRKPLGIVGVIHHSDRGVQYASKAYVEALKVEGIQISMSDKGNPYDNAYAESFMKTFKVEEVYLNEYLTYNDAYENIQEFIENVYNKKRLHSAIGYMSPEEYEWEVLKRKKLQLA